MHPTPNLLDQARQAKSNSTLKEKAIRCGPYISRDGSHQHKTHKSKNQRSERFIIIPVPVGGGIARTFPRYTLNKEILLFQISVILNEYLKERKEIFVTWRIIPLFGENKNKVVPICRRDSSRVLAKFCILFSYILDRSVLPITKCWRSSTICRHRWNFNYKS